MYNMGSKLNTVALLISELVPGEHYQCILADDRRVQYIGDGKIKWYSPAIDEYKIAAVHDYQLKPLT